MDQSCAASQNVRIAIYTQLIAEFVANIGTAAVNVLLMHANSKSAVHAALDNRGVKNSLTLRKRVMANVIANAGGWWNDVRKTALIQLVMIAAETHTHNRLSNAIASIPAARATQRTALKDVFDKIVGTGHTDTIEKGGTKLVTVVQLCKGFPFLSFVGSAILHGNAREENKVALSTIQRADGSDGFIDELANAVTDAASVRVLKVMRNDNVGQLYLDQLAQQFACDMKVKKWHGANSNNRDGTEIVKHKKGHGKRQDWSAANYQAWDASDAFRGFDVGGESIVSVRDGPAGFPGPAISCSAGGKQGYSLADIAKMAGRIYNSFNPNAAGNQTCPAGDTAWVDFDT